MKALILYKDWLLLNRGEIRPEIGDKIFITAICENEVFHSQYITIEENSIENNEIWFKSIFGYTHYTIFDYCYVEIDYNPNESIEFANWISENYHSIDSDEYENNKTGEFKTTEDLYKQFKNDTTR